MVSSRLAAAKRPFRMRRGLDRVDVEVVGAGMAGIAHQHALQHRDDLHGPVPGLAVLGPQVPRIEVHHALGVDRRRVEIVGIGLAQRLHARREVLRQLGQVGVRDRSNSAPPALRHRRARAPAPSPPASRLLHQSHGLLQLRPARPAGCSWGRGRRRCPTAASASGIQLRSALERADRLRMVEREGQDQALVEIALRVLLRGRDGVVMVAQPVDQGDGLVVRRGARRQQRDDRGCAQ